MKKKTVSEIMLTLLLVGMLTLVFNIQPVNASDRSIHVRPDGSIDPPTSPIQRDGDIYTFTDDIYDSIVVETNNIVVDGAGYTLQGTGSGTGIDLSGKNNVTIKNVQIKGFTYGILLIEATNNNISENNITNNGVYGIGVVGYGISRNNICGNNITNNYWGIGVSESGGDSISGNNITNNETGISIFCSHINVSRNNITNNQDGIWLWAGLYTIIYGNNIADNTNEGVYLTYSYNNIVSENNIITNGCGIGLFRSSDNSVYHNDFVGNSQQVYSHDSTNVWDDGYPSGGNYWSDYAGVDKKRGPKQNRRGVDGIGDTPYVIDENNQDSYPLMATPEAINYAIQNSAPSEFEKPEEDVEDIKNDFADKFGDVEENIDERNYELAIEQLEEIKDFVCEQIVNSTKRQKISMIESLIVYLENFF